MGDAKEDTERRYLRRYGVAAILSAALSLGLPILLHDWLGVHEAAAVALALSVTFLLNFLFIRNFVFRSAGNVTRQGMAFGVSSAMFRAIEYMAFLGLSALGLDYRLSLLLVLGTSFFGKFFLHNKFVFVGPRRPDHQS